MKTVKQQSSQSLSLAIGLFVILMLAMVVFFEWTRPRPGTIIIPAGNTYLGPI